MRVAGYTRVSTPKQAQSGYSLSGQQEDIAEFCQSRDWEFTRLYQEPGRSGKSRKGRVALAQLMEDAKAGLFDRVVVWNLKRLGRNLKESLQISDELLALGVEVLSVTEAFDARTPQGRMVRNVLMTFAEYDREMIIEAIQLGVKEKARQGEIVGPLSLGLSRDDAGLLYWNDRAPHVRHLFELYAEGSNSLRELGQWAAATGLKSVNGKPLDRMSIRKILMNPIYVGDLAYHQRRGGSIIATGVVPGLVDRELFDKAHEQLSIRRYGGSRSSTWGREPYPLTGVAICASCGAPLSGSRAGRNLRYLRCSTTARRGRQACAQPMVAAEVVEDQIATYVSNMRLPLEYIEAVVDELRQRHRPMVDEAELAALRRQIDNWRRLFVIGEIDEPGYRREVAPIRRQLEELGTMAQPLDVERAMQLLRAAGELWHEGEGSKKRAFVTEVFDRIVVDGAQVTEIAPKAVYAPLFLVDRQERFGGDLCVVWLPGQDSNLQHGG